jgi:uncharacterized metal-binding protein
MGSMSCLAALGAELSGYVESARSADRNIVLDGCPVACGAQIYARLGLRHEEYLLTNYGVEKGKTEITDELVAGIAERVKTDIEMKRG